MIVTTVVVGVVLAGVTGFAVSAVGVVRGVNVRMNSSADAQLGTDAISRALRVATVPAGVGAALVSAGSSSLTFYSALDRSAALVVNGVQVPSKIEYYRSAGCLYEAFTPARAITGGYAWDTGRVTRCLVRTDATSPLFSYYTSGSGTTALTVPAGGLAAAVLPTVQSVEIDLEVLDADEDVPAVTAGTRVTLTNVVLGAGGTA